MKVKAEWQGMEALDAEFAALSRGMQGQALRGALRAAAAPIVKRAKADSPSRRVRKALKSVVTGQGAIALARIGAAKKTAGGRLLHLVEGGARPHMIVPRRAKVLASGGITKSGRFALVRQGVVFGRRVQHPGARARPFFKAALPRERAESERKFGSALRKIIANLQLRKLKQQGRG
jgi:hypothetical protein